MSTKGQVVLPAELRERDGLDAGQVFDVERLDRGVYRLVARPRVNEGVVDWLLSCPEKGYFVPVASESTDALAPALPRSGGGARRRSRSRRARRAGA